MSCSHLWFLVVYLHRLSGTFFLKRFSLFLLPSFFFLHQNVLFLLMFFLQFSQNIVFKKDCGNFILPFFCACAEGANKRYILILRNGVYQCIRVLTFKFSYLWILIFTAARMRGIGHYSIRVCQSIRSWDLLKNIGGFGNIPAGISKSNEGS